MAKKDKTDETPIEFYIPQLPWRKRSQSSYSSQSTKLDIQEKFKFKANSSEWFIIALFLVVASRLASCIIVIRLYRVRLYGLL